MVTKNQHYVPACILKHFANSKGQLYEALVKEGKVYRTNRSQAMSERFIYEHPILPQNILETYFHRIENYLSPALDRMASDIDSLGDSGSLDAIKKQVRKYLREFIIFYYRSGALFYEYGFDERERQERVVSLLQNLMRSEYIRSLAKTIERHYDFAVIKSEDRGFLLSDQYLSTAGLAVKNQFSNISNRNMGLRDVIILIPISCSYYAVYSHGKTPDYIVPEKHNVLTAEQVHEVNRTILNNSYRKCVGYNEAFLRESMESFVYRSPSGVRMVYDSGAVAGATLKKEVFFYPEERQVWDFLAGMKMLKFEGMGRNDLCACGSGKKFKKCCLYYYSRASSAILDIKNKIDVRSYAVHPTATVERGINEFFVPGTSH